MSNEFLYTLEKHNSLPDLISNRSMKWRRLREALSELKIGEWIKVGIPDNITDPVKRDRFAENIRSGGVSAYYQSLGGDKLDYRFPTHIQRDEKRVAVAIWVGKITKPQR